MTEADIGATQPCTGLEYCVEQGEDGQCTRTLGEFAYWIRGSAHGPSTTCRELWEQGDANKED